MVLAWPTSGNDSLPRPIRKLERIGGASRSAKKSSADGTALGVVPAYNAAVSRATGGLTDRHPSTRFPQSVSRLLLGTALDVDLGFI